MLPSRGSSATPNSRPRRPELIRLVVVLLLSAGAGVLANQSPINIDPHAALEVKRPPLLYKDYERKFDSFLQNTGHGCQITVQHPAREPRVRGGPLAKEHVLEQVHFHWGPADGRGSEHYVDGEAYSMEAHLVHYNSKYKSFAEAVKMPDGLAVVALFLECADCAMSAARRRRLVCSAGLAGLRRRVLAPLCKASDRAWARAGALLDRYLSAGAGQRIRSRLFPTGPGGYKNTEFQPLVDAIPSVRRAGSGKVEVKADLLGWAVPSLEESGYYTYDGSLTTEPYSENVIWIVYKSIIPIGKAQIEPFRSIENDENRELRNNFRDLQSHSQVRLWWVP